MSFSSLLSIFNSTPLMSRIKRKLSQGDLIVSGDQWPIFLYAGESYDPEDPWNGLLRSALLVSVPFSTFTSS